MRSTPLAYGTAPMLHWMVNEKNIAPHVRVWDKTQRKDETISIADFDWNEEANQYTCPEGHPFKSNWRLFKTPRNHVTQADRCVPGKPA